MNGRVADRIVFKVGFLWLGANVQMCVALSMNAYQIEDKCTKHNTNYCVK